MNHRDTKNAERRTTGVLVALCALCLCGSTSVRAAESWPRVYNEGVTAYRSNDLAKAVAAFERALASPERELQVRSRYNLGNTHYRLGQAAEKQGIEQALPVYEKSLKEYEGALALNAQDEDAKFNRDLVKKKIEELKKQQQEQQQQKQDKGDQKDQDKKDQDKQDQQKPDEQQQQQQKPDSSQEQKPQEQPAQTEPKPAENLDKQQAAALLDQLREEEKNWNFFPELQMKDLKEAGQPVKDW